MITASGLAKWYPPRAQPAQRFWQALRGPTQGTKGIGVDHPAPESLIALHPLSFELTRGKVLGVVGKNGAGKSTLLQLLAGTLEPSAGTLQVNGRVAALLELGAGFNPEFTGVENVQLNAALLGLSSSETKARLPEILAFADIGDFVYRPVKTYSSGMFVRLAFAVAVCLDPEILIIDEALSVGDGQFARKSFDRIMALKESGRTILFCSHSLYQVEALCDQALWLDQGQLKMYGHPADVIAAYSQFLDQGQATATPYRVEHERVDGSSEATESGLDNKPVDKKSQTVVHSSNLHSIDPVKPRIMRVRVWNGVDEIDMRSETQRRILLHGQSTDLTLEIHWSGAGDQAQTNDGDAAALDLTVAVTLMTASGQCLTAVSTLGLAEVLKAESNGNGSTRLVFPRLPLRKGIFRLDVLLGCGRALQLFDHGIAVLTLDARSAAAEQGFVNLPHRWERPNDSI